MKEIERKWILPEIPKWCLLPRAHHVMIDQGYLNHFSSEDEEVRVRWSRNHTEESFTLSTKVSTSDPMVREENTIHIPKKLFGVLWSLTSGSRVYKNRYQTTHDVYTVEVDLFFEKDNLVLMECEFPTVQEAEHFVLPDWAEGAVDVTNDKRYKNRSLAIHD